MNDSALGTSALNQGSSALIADELLRERLLGRRAREGSTLVTGRRLSVESSHTAERWTFARLAEERSSPSTSQRRRDRQVLIDAATIRLVSEVLQWRNVSVVSALDPGLGMTRGHEQIAELWRQSLDRQFKTRRAASDAASDIRERARPTLDEAPTNNLAAIQLLDAWLSEEPSDEGRRDWRRLRIALDEDRPAIGKLFK